ncbi:hypothetical protein BJ508DRAFT_302322 [Ascobolus immersus RN42]|uniref:Uncharacterized protein n=1 Tax=Ascobolus immersus RN42 TaxID=1160509 RepID=A0A3N4IWD2_ASCIM|nr:hypothetical protein BJ508DRAFT_302322 [Ascobolus immersus RN42]
MSSGGHATSNCIRASRNLRLHDGIRWMKNDLDTSETQSYLSSHHRRIEVCNTFLSSPIELYGHAKEGIWVSTQQMVQDLEAEEARTSHENIFEVSLQKELTLFPSNVRAYKERTSSKVFPGSSFEKDSRTVTGTEEFEKVHVKRVKYEYMSTSRINQVCLRMKLLRDRRRDL